VAPSTATPTNPSGIEPAARATEEETKDSDPLQGEIDVEVPKPSAPAIVAGLMVPTATAPMRMVIHHLQGDTGAEARVRALQARLETG
jgi:hypothetical protein